MKKLLILIVAVALFLHFFPQPKVESLFEEYKTMALNVFTEATDTKVRLKADKIYTDLISEFDSFNDDEQSFLKEITADRKSVNEFFSKYCEKDRPTPKFHRENQTKICRTIAKYSSLL